MRPQPTLQLARHRPATWGQALESGSPSVVSGPAGNDRAVFRRRRRVAETEEIPPPAGQYVREEVVEPPPPRRRPLIWPWLLLLLLLVLGGLALGYVLTRDDGATESRVPDVVGLTEVVAVQRLVQSGYTADVRRRPTRTATVGRVFDQEPDAGAELDRGERTLVFVARGPGTVDVPNVVGDRVSEALERVQDAGLRVRVREVFSRGREGVVVRQQPAGGKEARRRSTVVLSVSKGRQLVTVPDLVGRSEADAGAALARVGLRPNVVRVPSSDAPGTVVAQLPPAGGQQYRGATVQINVSKGRPTPTGPTQGTVPDVVGQDETAARETLSAAGYAVRTVEQPTRDPAQDGVVLRQSPRAGQSAPRGSQVVIFVSRLA
jgi:eukaryotic-like serine/threonine-protein kinase